MAVLQAALVLMIPTPAAAQCPPDPPPPECDIDAQFLGGRWDMSQLSGSYTLSGQEVYYPNLDDDSVIDNFTTSATLSAEKLGGSEDNYIDVACDGTVTGRGRERITGTVLKAENVVCPEPPPGRPPSFLPQDMDWTVTIERSYSITGNVSGNGQLDLDYQMDEATMDFSGMIQVSDDCGFFRAQRSFTALDMSGDTEQVRLAGGYDPDAYRFDPTVSARGGKFWIDEALHGLRFNVFYEYAEPPIIELNPAYLGPDATQPDRQDYRGQFFIQDAVSVQADLTMGAEPETPIIESMELLEPTAYLRDVNVDTQVQVEIDWRGQAPGQVEFTYGSTSETVAGANTVMWEFDAGEAGSTIRAVAINGDERSEPYLINTPKVVVPGWAGSAADWTGASGVRYDGQLAWPVSLQTTRTLSTIDLFSGLFGISGSASSDFDAVANSNGSPGSGQMETRADFAFADRSFEFSMQGDNQTFLSCNELTTTGSATSTLPAVTWERTLNPLTAVPGLQTAACGLSSYLCDVIGSVGIKASAQASLSGTGDYSGEGAEIRWVGGSLGGTLSGRIGAGAGLPPPLASVANVSLYGGATGCIEVEVAPDFQISRLGGFMEVGADVSFLGLSASANQDWPFGDGCGGCRAVEATLGTPVQSWVPADGQLAMAVTRVNGKPAGIAVWSEAVAGQARPAGAIRYRNFRNNVWGSIEELPQQAAANLSPSVAYDRLGRTVIVYVSSNATLPQQPADLSTFADTLELQWAVLDDTGVAANGTLTANAQHDLGPQLVRDSAGGLQLFWQRVSGVEISGSPGAPAAILSMRWDADSLDWSAEALVADGLTHTWGWNAAAHSADQAALALSVDTDGDLATANDRELRLLQRDANGWGAAQVLTSNFVSDHAPQLVFDEIGDATLLWRQGDSVMQLRGDLQGVPSLAFGSAAPAVDDGIGEGFAHARIAARSGVVQVLWTESTRLQQSRRAAADAPWTLPTDVLGTEAMETIYALQAFGSDTLLAYSVRDFDANGIPQPALEPRVVSASSVFADGFGDGL